MDCTCENTHCIINFTAQQTIESILDQKQIFLQALHSKKKIIIEASKVSTIDTASLQLLLSFLLSLDENHLIFEWKHPSIELIKLAELAGMRTLLKLPNIPG